MEAAGFQVTESLKLTTEIRGSIQLLNHFVPHLRCPERRLRHLAFALIRKVYFWIGVPLLNSLGESFREQGLVAGNAGSSLYLGVAVMARKPK